MVRSCTHGVNRSFAVVRTACGRAFWVKMLLGTGLFGLDWTLKARHVVLLLVDSCVAASCLRRPAIGDACAGVVGERGV